MLQCAFITAISTKPRLKWYFQRSNEKQILFVMPGHFIIYDAFFSTVGTLAINIDTLLSIILRQREARQISPHINVILAYGSHVTLS